MFRSKSPARGVSPRPSAQQDTKLLHALFMAEEHKQAERRLSTSAPSYTDPSGRRLSSSRPSQSEPISQSTNTTANTSQATSQVNSERASPVGLQDGNVHVVRDGEARV